MTIRNWFINALNAKYRYTLGFQRANILDKIKETEFGESVNCIVTEKDASVSILTIEFEDNPISIEIHWKSKDDGQRVMVEEFK